MLRGLMALLSTIAACVRILHRLCHYAEGRLPHKRTAARQGSNPYGHEAHTPEQPEGRSLPKPNLPPPLPDLQCPACREPLGDGRLLVAGRCPHCGVAIGRD